MPAFYRALVSEFIASSDRELTGILSLAYARDGFANQKAQQTLAWAQDIFLLRATLTDLVEKHPSAASWHVLLEFNIPRKMRRIDVVLLAGSSICILEQKSHSPTTEDCLQAEEYALLLHYFHEPSSNRRIVPFVVSSTHSSAPENRQSELPLLETAAFWIAPVERVCWKDLASRLADLPHISEATTISASEWEQGVYNPVPTIIQAALSLQSGLDIREVAHSKAARHDIDDLTILVKSKIAEARSHRKFMICFVTGVPGSGKTLVGLNLAFSKQVSNQPIHFMSGNGPLVMVLQAVLARHQMSQQVRALDARLHAKTLVENVHVFARTYTDDPQGRAPSNHVIIFDEAQRAWDRAQNFAKFKRNYSEPEMLLKIMERHEDWAVIVALVGGGQEINNGEAGLEEWGRSLAASSRIWEVFASSEAVYGGASVAAGKLLLPQDSKRSIVADAKLHLDVSVRSLKADSYARWVNHVIEGEPRAAAALRSTIEFPIRITRDLAQLRRTLKASTRGLSRSGLVASAQAARLRAEGLEPDSAFHGGYPWHHWYLAPASDVRSSYQLEVFATEFEIQGLELDWIGLCWGGDFVWSPQHSAWHIRTFRAASQRWTEVKSEARRKYRRNAYRVLLTRARQGIVLFIPHGAPDDPTRAPADFDDTATYLIHCGAEPLSQADAPASTPSNLNES